jgi:hypothetical protein
VAKTSITIFSQPIATATLTGFEATASEGDFSLSLGVTETLSTAGLLGELSDVGVEITGSITVPLPTPAMVGDYGDITVQITGDVAPVITSTPSVSFARGTPDQSYTMS